VLDRRQIDAIMAGRALDGDAEPVGDVRVAATIRPGEGPASG
jgi:hypothetical protein